jgi:SAM-dependent methyltransferase
MSDERARSFGAVAETYDRYRPSPPPEAAALLGELEGKRVLEVAAGTGLWTRFLLSLGAELTIVEPDDQMRAVLERRSPHVASLVGTAESLPVDDASFDVVVSSSAWHWFTQPDATNEMARVLVDGGTLFVLWNGFSRDVEWVNELTALRDVSDPSVRPRSWHAVELSDDRFSDVTQLSLDWTWRRSVQEVVSLYGTYSASIIRSGEERRKLQDAVRVRVEKISVDGSIDIPMTLRGTRATRSVR